MYKNIIVTAEFKDALYDAIEEQEEYVYLDMINLMHGRFATSVEVFLMEDLDKEFSDWLPTDVLNELTDIEMTDEYFYKDYYDRWLSCNDLHDAYDIDDMVTDVLKHLETFAQMFTFIDEVCDRFASKTVTLNQAEIDTIYGLLQSAIGDIQYDADESWNLEALESLSTKLYAL